MAKGVRRIGWLAVPAVFAAAAVAERASARGDLDANGLPKTRKQEAVVELGRRLFFDPAVSRSALRSCASCHDPEHGWSDSHRLSDDDFGRTKRHSQTLLDSHRNPSAHWDGEFESVEELVFARLGVPSGRTRGGYGQPPPPSSEPIPPEDEEDEEEPEEPDEGPVTPTEEDDPTRTTGTTRRPNAADLAPAFRSHGAFVTQEEFQVVRMTPVADVLESSGRYDEAFRAAYGSGSVTTARLADAIATFVRSIRSTETPFDRHLAGDEEALSPAARRGLALFRGKARCAACHTIDGPGSSLTDYRFHVTGIAWRAKHPDDAPPSLEGIDAIDAGRRPFDTNPKSLRAFKTPTLRDAALRPPYMHDGSLPTLEAVVRYYAGGGSSDPRQDRRIGRLDLSDGQVADLVAFLESLTGEVRSGLAPTVWRARARETTVRFVDGFGHPMAGMEVEVVPAGDTLPGDLPLTSPTRRCTTDDDGRIEFVPPFRTHARLVLPEGLEPVGGTLVPDTCAHAEVILPVSGRAVLVVSAPRGRPLPDRLLAEHVSPIRLPKPLVKRTVLRQDSFVETGDLVVARYEAWFRTDADPLVSISFPGEGRPAVAASLLKEAPVRVDLEH
jgi:cytochrome c peroxidase